MVVNQPRYKPIRDLFLYWIIYLWCSKLFFFVLMWSCILKKLRCLMRQWQQGYYCFHDLITCSSTAVITSGCTSCHYVTLLVRQQTDTQSSGCETMQWIACALDMVRGWFSDQHFNYASLPQITATSLNNSGHISIFRIDLRQEVLKKRRERLWGVCLQGPLSTQSNNS